MTVQNIVRHKQFVLFVIAENRDCLTVANRNGRQGIWYPKTGKLVFRARNGKMARI